MRIHNVVIVRLSRKRKFYLPLIGRFAGLPLGAALRDDGCMDRCPLWIGEVDLVRAVFGHAVNTDPGRLLRVASGQPAERVIQFALEQRLGKRRLDVLLTIGDDAGRPGRWVVVEAKVGAVVDFDTLSDYLTGIEDRYGPATGLLVAPYEPVGPLPSG